MEDSLGRTITVLDGGMGRELERMGAPFRQPEWSALALIEAPDFVRRAHASFIAAGADVITTNSYALVPFHIGEDRFASDGRRLADLAWHMARKAADEAGRKILVAGSLPPLFGSYRPDLFDAGRAPGLLDILIGGLAPHVDHWLAETQGSVAEVKAVGKALATDKKPLWLSFTLEDEEQADPKLRSGEPVDRAAAIAAELGAEALLFNCSQPEVMRPALEIARNTLAKLGAAARTGAYANAFPPQPKDAEANAHLHSFRPEIDPQGYLRFAKNWAADGATIIGGCCGIGPHHIAELAKALN